MLTHSIKISSTPSYPYNPATTQKVVFEPESPPPKIHRGKALYGGNCEANFLLQTYGFEIPSCAWDRGQTERIQCTKKEFGLWLAAKEAPGNPLKKRNQGHWENEEASKTRIQLSRNRRDLR